MRAPFDLFKKDQQGNFVWLEAVTDLPTAKTRLKELNARAPGEYMVFDHIRLEIIERLNSDCPRPH
jgi:hypothetical protein